MSGPKPVQKPHPRIVCATGSEAGFRFVAEQCDEAFLGSSMAVDKNTVGDKTAAKTNASQKAKEMARELGRTIKTQTLVIVVPAESDEEGREILEHYRQGADYEAITNLWDPGYPGDKVARGKELAGGPGDYPARIFYYAPAFAGSPKTTADLLEELAVDGDFDGLLLSFPDYMEGLSYMQKKIMPILRSRHLLPS
jgi:pyrimidine oxygenase